MVETTHQKGKELSFLMSCGPEETSELFEGEYDWEKMFNRMQEFTGKS